MKKIFLLLLFLVPYLTNAAHYQRVYLDSSSQSLDTNSGTNYFYIYSNWERNSKSPRRVLHRDESRKK